MFDEFFVCDLTRSAKLGAYPASDIVRGDDFSRPRKEISSMTSFQRFACVSTVLLVVSPAVFAAEPASAADKTFVGQVSQGGAYEVEASKVAVMRATMPDVKDLAIAEVHDHEGVGANLKRISAATGIPIAPLNAEFTERLAKLKAVPAANFDAAYIADMKSIHAKDEKLFAQEANDGSSNFKTFAHETDLIVKRHIGGLSGY